MSMEPSIPFRIVSEAGEPLGLFFRPGKEDHKVLQQLLSEGQVGMHGAILGPNHCNFQEDLRSDLHSRNLDVILDTGMLELATLNGHTSRKQFPWANPCPHVPADFDSNAIRLKAEAIAQFVATYKFTAVLAPTHYLAQGIADPWLPIDQKLVLALREALDSANLRDVSIYYPLAIQGKLFVEANTLTRLKAVFSSCPIDSLWLRIHPFGSDSGDTILRRYILACRELHSLGVPVVAEKTGVLGLALLAFGAVSGLESGIANGEKFDHSRLTRPRKPGSKFGKTSRVYLPDCGLFLSRKEAEEFFSIRGTRQYACRNTQCCGRGYESMVADSRRHFTHTRMGQVAHLSRLTPSLRPMGYLEDILRPSTDNLSRILGLTQLSGGLRSKFDQSRRRQDGWRATLGQMGRLGVSSFSAPIERRIHRSPFQASA